MEKKRRRPSRGNLYFSGRVKGCLHRVEGECDTRAFLRSRRPSIITSPTSHKNNDFLATGSRLSRLFPIASVRFACICVYRHNLIASYLVNSVMKGILFTRLETACTTQ